MNKEICNFLQVKDNFGSLRDIDIGVSAERVFLNGLTDNSDTVTLKDFLLGEKKPTFLTGDAIYVATADINGVKINPTLFYLDNTVDNNLLTLEYIIYKDYTCYKCSVLGYVNKLGTTFTPKKALIISIDSKGVINITSLDEDEIGAETEIASTLFPTTFSSKPTVL